MDCSIRGLYWPIFVVDHMLKALVSATFATSLALDNNAAMSRSPTIIPALYARQKSRGYLTPEDMRLVADQVGVPLYRIQSVVSFYPHFRLTPPPKVEVHVCRDMSCHLRGSVPLIDRLTNWANQAHGDNVEVCGVSCLGRCDRPIATFVNEQLFVGRDEAELAALIDQFVDGEAPRADSDREWSQSQDREWQIDFYTETADYRAVKDYLANPRPERLLNEPDGMLTVAGLLGMGGAGGRAYKKWNDVREAKGSEKYVVCNADESEPGTFKDREIMLCAPHLVLEGMIVAGLVVGAERGWVYLRHEYPEQRASLQAEIERARAMGALGSNICSSGKSFDIEIFVSPGNYICGEQTALIEALEDNRAEPRNRPPELMTNGYWNQPTLLSNVETFAWVPAIMLREAGQWFANEGRKSGTWVAGQGEKMKGRRLFSISGDVARPGAYEVPTGITLGELIDQHCGGMRDGQSLAAVALSGPSGGLLPARIPIRYLNRRFVESFVPDGMTEIDIREIPLDINVSRALGIMIGAGIVVYGSGADLLSEAVANSRFFRNESCGKCVPCRIGSTKITELGEQLLRGQIEAPGLSVLSETVGVLSDVMAATSICGLGQVASNPLNSFLKFFPQLAEQACSTRNPRST